MESATTTSSDAAHRNLQTPVGQSSAALPLPQIRQADPLGQAGAYGAGPREHRALDRRGHGATHDAVEPVVVRACGVASLSC